MVDEYSEACERKQATEIIVNRYHHDTPGSGQCGQTRQAGVVANGKPDGRESGLSTFKGRENLRRANTR
jgi:hypothetical protein